jgi:hypothetical protein
MALPPRKGKKPPPDAFTELLDEEPAEADAYEPEEEFGDEGGFDDFEDPAADPLMAEGEDMGPTIDPEMAALAQTLGFTEPEQQQALIDLIRLVNEPSDMLGDPAMGGSPLESVI